MTKQTHTPTPWGVDEIAEDEAGQETLGIYAEEGGYVCGIHCGSDTQIDEQDQANVAFIVKAVNCHDELVKLLKEIHFAVERGDTDQYSSSGDWFNEVTRLLAKVND